MKIYNVKEDKIITEKEFRRSFPNTRFPANLKREFLQKRGCDVVVEADHPTYDNDMEYLEPGAGELRSDGYHSSWMVKEKPLSKEDKDKILADRQKAADHIAEIKDREQAVKDAKESIKIIKEAAKGKSLSIEYLDDRLTAIETILGVVTV